MHKASHPDHHRWISHTANTRGCVRPVRLTGSLHTVDTTTGEILGTRHTATDMPDGVLYVPCGDRRASVCPPCAETYRADTYQLIRSGLVGGKGVPESVAGHPAVFATFTAPSFGPVHTRVVNTKTGKVRPCRIRRDARPCPHGKLLTCTQRHTDNASCLGRPICLDCYDHAAHVVWNAWAGELWRRTMIRLGRDLRPYEHAHGIRLRVSYGKVAEYQRRGVVHFHALIRLDTRPNTDPKRGPLQDPDAILPPPEDITPVDLAELVAGAASTTAFRTPDYLDTGHSWPITWGPQIDIRPVAGLADGEITSEAVAAYLAKYATKATEPTGLPTTGRMTAEAAEHYSDARTHLGRLVAYAFQLGTPPEDLVPLGATDDERDQLRRDWHDTWGRLRRWTHMLGFGGHFATKSRRYSTTHRELRAARRIWRRTTQQQWQRDQGHDVDDTTLVVADLTLAGIGWNSTADAQLAASAAARAREYRALVKQERTTTSA
ncbi:replication initiator [Pseudonocardia sp. CA-107938]|uniref:replication initiator n=1 Tax=Pseudonocardia sp. CA-107938 TaxID=3240021 RepID=UPI003D92A252